jgi:Xaa-Pro aminopeptidase
MKYCQPNMFEYQLEAEIMHEFMAAGSRAAAYTTIVGAGI